jgi:hypothetical protein
MSTPTNATAGAGAEVVVLGSCLFCRKRGRLSARASSIGCARCLERLGERWFELAARCVRSPAFARAVFAKIPAHDRAGQARFVELFGADFLREPRRDQGSGEGTIDLGRKLENRGTWEHRQEWTVPPPPMPASAFESRAELTLVRKNRTIE